MNDPKGLFNPEASCFGKSLEKWKTDLPKSKVFHEYQKLSQKMTFDDNPKVIISSMNR